MRNSLAILLVLMIGACQPAPTKTEFEIRTDEAARYGVRLWKTTTADQSDVVNAVLRTAPDREAKGEVTLRCRPGDAVVQIASFDTDQAAETFAQAVVAGVRAPLERRVMRVVSSAHQPGAPLPTKLVASSSVQWSEYLMKPGADIGQLQTMTETMHASMASPAGQPALQAISQLRSADDKAIGMIALWTTREGFEVFAKQKTWGDKGYWEDYANNEHWMCDVAGIR